ncbi:hypothetical protein N2152v2_004032 [Parachlorella kessleri]
MTTPIRLQLSLALHAFLVWVALADNFAVIVSSSRYWHNYRHAANALSVYTTVRRLGIPDSNIILMSADEVACDPRNPLPGEVHFDMSPQRANLYSGSVQVDYGGREVNVGVLLQVLTGRHPASTPRSKRLASGRGSTVLLYMTGHGGDEFLKFHDQEELLAADLAAALQQMHLAGRYKELLVIVDTCQASSLFSRITAPSIIGIGTSKPGESSYAHFADPGIGVHLADQFTYHMYNFLTPLRPGSNATLQQLMDNARRKGMLSTIVPWASKAGGRQPSQVRVMEFFSAVEASPADVGGYYHSQATVVEGQEGLAVVAGRKPMGQQHLLKSHPDVAGKDSCGATDVGDLAHANGAEEDRAHPGDSMEAEGTSLYSMLLHAPCL